MGEMLSRWNQQEEFRFQYKFGHPQVDQGQVGAYYVVAPCLSQYVFQANPISKLTGPLFRTDLYFAGIYKITISICQCSAFPLKEACLYALLPLSH